MIAASGILSSLDLKCIREVSYQLSVTPESECAGAFLQAAGIEVVRRKVEKRKDRTLCHPPQLWPHA